MTLILSPGTRLGAVTLGVADLDRSAEFYRDLAGLHELERTAGRLTLGAGGVAVLHLDEERGAQRPPRRASGLFHTAILYPDRAALARTVKHILASNYPFTGASDHLVSEAFYLDDPDGLGVELYRDRARVEWRRDGHKIEMASLPLDVQDLLGVADRSFDGAPDGTRVGHVHLKVSDIAEAERFYRDTIGFSVTAHYGESATFLAADGYHHHIGANVWQSGGMPAAPVGHAGLRAFVVEVPGIAPQEFVDPWGHNVIVKP